MIYVLVQKLIHFPHLRSQIRPGVYVIKPADEDDKLLSFIERHPSSHLFNAKAIKYRSVNNATVVLKFLRL